MIPSRCQPRASPVPSVKRFSSVSEETSVNRNQTLSSLLPCRFLLVEERLRETTLTENQIRYLVEHLLDEERLKGVNPDQKIRCGAP